MTQEIARAALEYSARGWCVIPMRMTEKRPACKWKRFQSLRPDDRQVRRWFADGEHGIGVLFGAISGGLASRDFDTMDQYEKWAAERPDLTSRLPVVETRRGRHVYFRMDPATLAALRQRIGKPAGTGAIKTIEGELRPGVGCYSVLPPSKHPSGHVYKWQTPLPDGLLPIVDPIESGLFLVEPCNRENGEALKTGTVGRDGHNNNAYCLQDSLSSLDTRDAPCSLDTLPSLLQEAIENAIERTLPKRPRQRHENVFLFARELKAIPELADAPAWELKPIVLHWHELAKRFYRAPWEEHWFDFAEAWDKIRFPAGQGAVDNLFARAMESELPNAAMEYEQIKLRRLVALCRELQRAAGDAPIFLDCRTAGRLLDIDHTTASRWLRGLQQDGLLQLVARGNQKTRKASRYRYLADL